MSNIGWRVEPEPSYTQVWTIAESLLGWLLSSSSTFILSTSSLFEAICGSTNIISL